jgi:hypothetical protein
MGSRSEERFTSVRLNSNQSRKSATRSARNGNSAGSPFLVSCGRRRSIPASRSKLPTVSDSISPVGNRSERPVCKSRLARGQKDQVLRAIEDSLLTVNVLIRQHAVTSQTTASWVAMSSDSWGWWVGRFLVIAPTLGLARLLVANALRKTAAGIPRPYGSVGGPSRGAARQSQGVASPDRRAAAGRPKPAQRTLTPCCDAGCDGRTSTRKTMFGTPPTSSSQHSSRPVEEVCFMRLVRLAIKESGKNLTDYMPQNRI